MAPHRNKTPLFALLIVSLLLASCSGKKEATALSPARKADAENFVIALLPERNVFEQKKRYKLLAEYLSRTLRMNVKTKLLDSYDEVYSEIVKKISPGETVRIAG